MLRPHSHHYLTWSWMRIAANRNVIRIHAHSAPMCSLTKPIQESSIASVHLEYNELTRNSVENDPRCTYISSDSEGWCNEYVVTSWWRTSQSKRNWGVDWFTYGLKVTPPGSDQMGHMAKGQFSDNKWINIALMEPAGFHFLQSFTTPPQPRCCYTTLLPSSRMYHKA